MVSCGNSCVAVYDDPLRVRAALRLLQKKDVDLKYLSLVGQALVGQGEQNGNYSVGLYTCGDHVQLRGAQRLFWNEVWQYLPEAAFFWIPNIGSVVVAGPLGLMLTVALEEVVSGLNVLRAALYKMGVPNDSIVYYEHAVIGGAYLLIAQAETSEVERVHDLLLNCDARDIAIHLS